MRRVKKIKKLKVRLTLYYSSVIIINIIAIILLVGIIFVDGIRSEKTKTAEAQLEIVVQNMDEKIRLISQTYNSTIKNESIREIFISEESSNTRIMKMNNQLKQYCGEGSMISSIVAIDLNNTILHPVYSDSLYSRSVLENPYFERMKKDNKYCLFSPPVSFPINTSKYLEDKRTITCYFQYYDRDNYELLGYMLFNVNKNMFFQDVFNPRFELFENVFLVDESNQLIYSMNSEQNLTDSAAMADENMLIFQKSLSSYPSWKMYGIVDETKMMNSFLKMILILIIIGIMSVLLVVLFSAMISNNITRPIFKINDAIRQFEAGVWPPMITCDSEDEMQTLVRGFNNLLIRTNQLVDEVIKKQEDKSKAELETMKYKLDVLQMQINPHFIYNTLNAVTYVSRKKGEEEVADLIKDLTILLRNSMNSRKDMNTLQEELECLDSYIKIQRSRYGDIFDYRIIKEEGVDKYKIPKFTLQVLVENAIFHGIAPKLEKGTITVRIENNDMDIRLSIIDDGVGMDAEKIRHIFEPKDTKETGGFNNIGLSNILQRIKLIYGEEYGIQVTSEVGKGAEFIVCIPKQ